MPFYHKLGQLPHKRHTQYRKPDGGLYREEVMGLEGFSSLASILYHNFLPPRVRCAAWDGSRVGAHPAARESGCDPWRLTRLAKHGVFLPQRAGVRDLVGA